MSTCPSCPDCVCGEMIFILVITKPGRAGSSCTNTPACGCWHVYSVSAQRLGRLCYLHIQHTQIYCHLYCGIHAKIVYTREAADLCLTPSPEHSTAMGNSQALRSQFKPSGGLDCNCCWCSYFLSCIKPLCLQGAPLFAVQCVDWCVVFSGWYVAHEKVASLIDVQVVKLGLAAATLGLVSCET